MHPSEQAVRQAGQDFLVAKAQAEADGFRVSFQTTAGISSLAVDGGPEPAPAPLPVLELKAQDEIES